MKLFRFIGVMVVMLAVAGCDQGNVFSLDVGTCFNDVSAFYEGEGEVQNVPIVDCAEPHDNEVYHTFDIEGDEFPGAAKVEAIATEGCHGAFEDYVGREYETSRFALSPMMPLEQSWNQHDDREVLCFLYDGQLGKLEGSARDSGE